MATFKRIYLFLRFPPLYNFRPVTRGRGVVHVVRCTPFLLKGGCNDEVAPPLFLISSLVYKDFLSSSILYCVNCVCYMSKQFFTKAFPQTNQIKPSLKNICPKVRFWFVFLTLCRYVRHTYYVTNMFQYICIYQETNSLNFAETLP